MGFGRKKRIPVILALAALLAGAYFFAQEKPNPQPVPEQTRPVETTAAAETQIPETEPTVPRVRYDRIPNYYQTDYPYIKYGNGTIATSGCSMTCLAMVASYLTDHAYMPDELSYHFGSYGKNNIERLEYGSEQLGLPYEKVFDWRLVRSALAEGKVIIAMVDEGSQFTTAQHFIVLTGLNADNKITVNDPIKTNYDHSYLKTRFEKGFEDYDLIGGLSGAWIYDKSAVPENMVLFDASLPEQPETRYTGYNLPDEDVYTLACYASVVGAGKSEYLQQAILETVLNRMFSEEYPNTVDDLLKRTELRISNEKMAYADPHSESYRAVAAAMYGPYMLPMDVLHFTKGSVKGDVWGELEGFTFRYTK